MKKFMVASLIAFSLLQSSAVLANCGGKCDGKCKGAQTQSCCKTQAPSKSGWFSNGTMAANCPKGCTPAQMQACASCKEKVSSNCPNGCTPAQKEACTSCQAKGVAPADCCQQKK